MASVWPLSSHAAQMRIDIGSDAYDLHDRFSADVYFGTDSENINAVETNISFDQSKLNLVDIVDSDSMVNFWIEKKSMPGSVSLSGIIPGGFRGENGKIVSLVFETISSGSATIHIDNAAAFLNDGMGTSEFVSSTDNEIAISNQLSQHAGQSDLYLGDTYPPELFQAEVSQSPSLFNNKWFLVFSTEDKGSGIKEYRIKEARFRVLMFFKSWSPVESPYLLRDQGLTSFVAVKAIDKAGNETIAKVYPRHAKTILEKVLAGAILLVAAGVVLVLGKKLLKRLVKIDE
jgi:hypothetical protein